MAWTPDGRFLATASDDHALRVWDAASGACVRNLTGHTHFVSCCAFSAGSNLLVRARGGRGGHWHPPCLDRALLLLLRDAEAAGRADTRRAACLPPAAPPALPRQVSGGFDEALIVWDVRSGQPIKRIPGHSDPLSGVAFSGEQGLGELIASCSFDGLA